jgi:UDP-glucose 4-epimerase
MKGKKIVVTGGAGFIGSNLAWSLCDENEVAVIDNLSTGRIENIAPIIDSRKIQFIKGSITDLQLMKKVLTGVDIVFHEAAIPSVPRSIADPISTNEAGVTGTLTTLLAARDCGVKRFISASSSSVYGDTPTLPKHEEMPTNPISPYAATKVAGETYCRLFNELYGLSTVSLRYFNVFGPRQNPASQYAAVVPRFISKALSGEELVVYGDGLQTRDFTYVQDAVRANILAAEGSSSGSYNIASGKQITVRELASTILEITNSKAIVKYEAPRSGDIRHSLADITKARKAFGYAPSYSMQQGLMETVAWFSKGNR